MCNISYEPFIYIARALVLMAEFSAHNFIHRLIDMLFPGGLQLFLIRQVSAYSLDVMATDGCHFLQLPNSTDLFQQGDISSCIFFIFCFLKIHHSPSHNPSYMYHRDHLALCLLPVSDSQISERTKHAQRTEETKFYPHFP